MPAVVSQCSVVPYSQIVHSLGDPVHSNVLALHFALDFSCDEFEVWDEDGALETDQEHERSEYPQGQKHRNGF